MLGSFNQKSLELFQEAMSESMFSDFSEGDSYDFTTCIRPDGSAYGTAGKCRKGTEGQAKAKGAAPKSQVDLVTPQKMGPADVDRIKKYREDESAKLKNLNDSLKKNPNFANDPAVASRKKILERNVAAANKELKDLEGTSGINLSKVKAAKAKLAADKATNGGKRLDRIQEEQRLARNKAQRELDAKGKAKSPAEGKARTTYIDALNRELASYNTNDKAAIAKAKAESKEAFQAYKKEYDKGQSASAK